MARLQVAYAFEGFPHMRLIPVVVLLLPFVQRDRLFDSCPKPVEFLRVETVRSETGSVYV